MIDESRASKASSGPSSVVSEVEDARDNVVYQTVRFIGVLNEFSRPDVRSALQAGTVCQLQNADTTLESIDAIRRIMIPALGGADETTRNDRAIAGVKFFSSLVAKSDDRPLTVDGRLLPSRRTFAQWFSFFAEFSASRFWRTPPPNPRSQEPEVADASKVQLSDDLRFSFGRLDIGDDLLRPSRSQNLGSVGMLKASHGMKQGSGQNERTSSPVGCPASHACFPSGTRPKVRREAKFEVVTDRSHLPNLGQDVRTRSKSGRHAAVVRSSDSDSEDSERTASTSSSSSTSGSSSPHGARRSRHTGRRRYSREVVAPGSFDGQGGVSLKRYLAEYENYFYMKFDGTARQKAQHLGEFLTGQARRAYDAVGGSHLEYPKVRRKLLSWYSGERISSKQSAEAEFERTIMRTGESYTIYALRLEHLASRAFHSSSRERKRRLCRKFWSSTPQAFVRVLAERRRNFSYSSRKKTLSWSAIKRVAETEDRFSKNLPEAVSGHSDVEVWYSRPGEGRQEPSSQRRRVRYTDEADISHGGVVYPINHAGGSVAVAPRSPERPICNWCGRRGHGVDNCWEKAGLCTLCGSDKHVKQSCHKFDESRPAFRPMCPMCEGSHLGKYCSDGGLNSNTLG